MVLEAFSLVLGLEAATVPHSSQEKNLKGWWFVGTETKLHLVQRN